MTRAQKIIIGTSAIIIVVGIIIWVVVANLGGGANPGQTGGTLPPITTSTSTFTAPTGSTIVIGTPQGSVTVNNFYINPVMVVPGNSAVEIIAANSYDAVYHVSDSSFAIALLSEPLSAAREAAEAAFIQKLGITESEACRLNVTEEAPVSVDQTYAGQNLGLSFCSGAIMVP